MLFVDLKSTAIFSYFNKPSKALKRFATQYDKKFIKELVYSIMSLL